MEEVKREKIKDRKPMRRRSLLLTCPMGCACGHCVSDEEILTHQREGTLKQFYRENEMESDPEMDMNDDDWATIFMVAKQHYKLDPLGKRKEKEDEIIDLCTPSSDEDVIEPPKKKQAK